MRAKRNTEDPFSTAGNKSVFSPQSTKSSKKQNEDITQTGLTPLENERKAHKKREIRH